MSESPGPNMSTTKQQAILEAFGRALGRETHVLAAHPDLLWQQFYNWLQWEAVPVPQLLTAELARRSTPGRQPWLRLTLPPSDSSAYVRRYPMRTHADYGSQVWVPHSCAFSPDGTRVAAIGSKSLLFVWDRKTGNLIAEREAVGSEFCAFEPDGAHLVALGNYRQGSRLDPGDAHWAIGVRRWDTQSWLEEKPHRPLVHGDYSYCMAISPNGRYAVVETDGRGRVLVWDLSTSTEQPAYTLRTSLVHASAFSPDSRYLLVCDDVELAVLDTTTWKHRHAGPGGYSVRACAVAPGGATIVTTYWTDEVKVWAAQVPEKPVQTLIISPRSVNRSGGVRCGSFSPDGARMVAAGSDHVVRLWDTVTGQELAAFEGHTAPVNTCCFSPDGVHVLSASDDGQVLEWDTRNPIQNMTRISKGWGEYPDLRGESGRLVSRHSRR